MKKTTTKFRGQRKTTIISMILAITLVLAFIVHGTEDKKIKTEVIEVKNVDTVSIDSPLALLGMGYCNQNEKVILPPEEDIDYPKDAESSDKQKPVIDRTNVSEKTDDTNVIVKGDVCGNSPEGGANEYADYIYGTLYINKSIEADIMIENLQGEAYINGVNIKEVDKYITDDFSIRVMSGRPIGYAYSDVNDVAEYIDGTLYVDSFIGCIMIEKPLGNVYIDGVKIDIEPFAY